MNLAKQRREDIEADAVVLPALFRTHKANVAREEHEGVDRAGQR